MSPKSLAKALRRRQKRVQFNDAAFTDSLSDEAVIAAYVFCCYCQGPLFADAAAAVRNATTAAGFVTLCNMAYAAHACPQKN